jgi:hypothetical protein
LHCGFFFPPVLKAVNEGTLEMKGEKHKKLCVDIKQLLQLAELYIKSSFLPPAHNVNAREN